MAVDLNKYNTPAKKGVDLNKYNMPGIPADSPEAQQYHPVNRLKSKSVTSSEPGILEKIEGWIGKPTQPGEGIGAGLPTEFQTQTALLENALKGLIRFPPQMLQDVLQRGPIKAGAGLLKFPFDVATQAANMAGAQIPPSTQIGEVPIEQIQAPTGAEARQQAFEDPTPLLLALVPLLKARLGGKPTPAGLEPKAVIPERSTTPPIDINKMLESRPEPQISKKGQTQPLASMVTKRGKELSKGVDLNKINESSKVTPEQARQDIAQKTQGVAGETVPPKIVIGGEGKKIREFMAEKAKPKEPWEIEKAGLYDKYQKLTPNESISSLEVGKYGKFDIPIKIRKYSDVAAGDFPQKADASIFAGGQEITISIKDGLSREAFDRAINHELNHIEELKVGKMPSGWREEYPGLKVGGTEERLAPKEIDFPLSEKSMGLDKVLNVINRAHEEISQKAVDARRKGGNDIVAENHESNLGVLADIARKAKSQSPLKTMESLDKFVQELRKEIDVIKKDDIASGELSISEIKGLEHDLKITEAMIEDLANLNKRKIVEAVPDLKAKVPLKKAKPVPPEVLADYPDLKPVEVPKVPLKTEQTVGKSEQRATKWYSGATETKTPGKYLYVTDNPAYAKKFGNVVTEYSVSPNRVLDFTVLGERAISPDRAIKELQKNGIDATIPATDDVYKPIWQWIRKYPQILERAKLSGFDAISTKETFSGKGKRQNSMVILNKDIISELKETAPTVNQKAEGKIPLTPKAEPPATIPPKPPTKPVATTPAPGRPLALTNAGIDYMREIANKTPLEKGQRQTWEQAGEKAISEGLDQRAVEIAEKVIEEKRMIATEEHAGMVMKYNELRREYNQVTDDISKAVERGESIENNLQKRRDAIEAQIDRLDEAVKIGGTPLGQALNIRKMRLSDQPMDVLSLTKEATARWKRKPTEAERLELKKFADSHAGREKLIDELWKQEEGRELIKAKVEAERQFEYEQRKARRTKAKENIDVEIADILKQIEKKGFHTRLHSTPLDPEMAYLTGKLAAAYIRKGGITLAGVVDRVRMHIPEITERNVYDALNTRNPKYQAKLRKVETERLRLMKQQANYLAKLEDAAEGKLTPPKPGIGKTTTVVATTEEIKALKRTVSDLRAKLSDTIMESRRLEKAQEILDKLRDQLINQYREVKRAPRKPIPSEALKSIREKIAEVKKELRLRDSIADLEEQIRTDQFKTPKKVEAKPLPENIERQLIEQKRLKRRVADYLRNKEKTRGQKIISETVNTIKTLQATADISATLRQGLVESVAHPGIAGRAQVKALKAMFNTYTAEQIDMSIRQHPNHLIRERAGLQLTEVGADLLSKREEMFGSNVLRKISGLKHVVEASERHMTTYLNLLRVGVFDKFVEAYPNATTAELRAYADALNKITGRGDLGRAAGGKIGAALNVTLFAPKFTASRFQAPWTIKKYWSMPRVRNQIAKDFAKTIAAGAGILALAKLAGYAVNIDDPRNPDWGKIKVGNTTYDVWGGFLQPARMMARLLIYGTDRAGLTGQMKTDQEKYGIEPLDIIENFAEYKAGPAVNIPNQLLTGKSMVGEKLETPQDWALQNLTAFWLRDAYDAYQDAGFGKAAGVSLATIVGMGANTYELSEMKTRREIKRLYYREGKKEEAETMRREWNDKHPDQQIGTNLSDPLKDEKIRQIKAMYQKKGREAARDLLKKINKTYNWDIKEEDIQ